MINKKIIALASLTDNYGLNDRKKYQGSSKNNICGDKIKIQLDIKNKVIKSFRYETESCIFCQASANLLAKSIIKRNISSIKNDIIKTRTLNITICSFWYNAYICFCKCWRII